MGADVTPLGLPFPILRPGPSRISFTMDQLAAAYDAYTAALASNNALDFDDLISLANAALMVPSIGDHYRRRFRWLLVDEFQDTDRCQYEFVRLLALPQVGRLASRGRDLAFVIALCGVV
jgi:superfamily I DNA/RNA helicase